ncbi:MAG: class I SAM-dependent methyltransferase [Rhodopirellula sp. JB055]|uniref:class I SAM-dependent methyltransferase n=1 Tax=Rhodopirellula sp. JB055 TaxID=3342846 RepID=UPI00370A944C
MTASPIELEVTDKTRAAMRDCIAGQLHSPVMRTLSSGTKAVLKDIAGLQTRATATLGPPIREGESWWVNRRAIQQSTTRQVAKFKACWFGDQSVTDICCGIGGDLIALARRGPTTGIDANQSLLSFTAANLITADVNANLRCLDVMESEPADVVSGSNWIHIDPDRRVDNQRHVQPDAWLPTWERTEALLNQVNGGLVKMAPATTLDSSLSDACHLMWISSGGSVREQTAIWGSLPTPPTTSQGAASWQAGGRTAVVLKHDAAQCYSAESGDSADPASVASAAQSWMIDPDGAIRAAGLTDHFARSHEAQTLGGPSGFLTADWNEPEDAPSSPQHACQHLAMVAPIRDRLSCDDRALRRYFRKANAYPEIIKARSVDIDPGKLGKKLRECGETPLALWIGRNGKKTYAVVTELPKQLPAQEG